MNENFWNRNVVIVYKSEWMKRKLEKQTKKSVIIIKLSHIIWDIICELFADE